MRRKVTGCARPVQGNAQCLAAHWRWMGNIPHHSGRMQAFLRAQLTATHRASTMMNPVHRSSSLVIAVALLASCSDDAAPPTALRPTATVPATIVLANSGTWTQEADLPAPRGYPGGGAIAGKFYIAGGYDASGVLHDNTYVYDPVANSWLERTPMTQAVMEAGSATYGGKLYLFGGTVNVGTGAVTNHTWIYDPVADSWTAGPDMPASDFLQTAVACGRHIYVAGGVSHHFAFLELDPSTGTWTPRADMPHGRYQAAMGCLGGKVYVTSGAGSDGEALDIFDPASHTWSSGAPQGIHDQATGIVVKNVLYFFHVESTFGDDQVHAYDPLFNSWTNLAHAPVGTKAFGATLGAIDGVIYTAGSYSTAVGGNGVNAHVWAFKPAAPGNHAPLIGMGYSDPNGHTEGDELQFSSSGTEDPDGDSFTVAWDFGDGATSTSESPTHTYAKYGSYLVRLTATDSHGKAGSSTLRITVLNDAPAISAFTETTLFRGETYNGSGSFTDAGDNTWVAKAVWGDRIVETLTLTNKAFTLAHQYARPGDFAMHVTVNDGRTTSSSGATIHVLRLSDAVLYVVTRVMAQGGLTVSDTDTLVTMLQSAKSAIADKNPALAITWLNNFKNKCDQLVSNFHLQQAQADELKGYADRLIALLSPT
jgi:N-acetylneuraminic acid mutarotase/PKD repeat protein